MTDRVELLVVREVDEVGRGDRENRHADADEGAARVEPGEAAEDRDEDPANAPSGRPLRVSPGRPPKTPTMRPPKMAANAVIWTMSPSIVRACTKKSGMLVSATAEKRPARLIDEARDEAVGDDDAEDAPEQSGLVGPPVEAEVLEAERDGREGQLRTPVIVQVRQRVVGRPSARAEAP